MNWVVLGLQGGLLARAGLLTWRVYAASRAKFRFTPREREVGVRRVQFGRRVGPYGKTKRCRCPTRRVGRVRARDKTTNSRRREPLRGTNPPKTRRARPSTLGELTSHERVTGAHTADVTAERARPPPRAFDNTARRCRSPPLYPPRGPLSAWSSSHQLYRAHFESHGLSEREFHEVR